ncbi:hypothetical protein ABK040_001208 [Willaertia magna]
MHNAQTTINQRQDGKQHVNASIIRSDSSDTLPQLDEETTSFHFLKSIKTRIFSVICSIAFLFPFLLASLVIITFILVFIINYIIPNNMENEMSSFLTTESTNRIKERLNYLTDIPPKVVAIFNDLQSQTFYLNDLQGFGRNVMKKIYLNYPEIPVMNLYNNDTLEQILYERLPNGTIYEGFNRDMKLYRYIVNSTTLRKIEGWGPVVIAKNYFPRERPWYKECAEKVNHWSKVIAFSTGTLGILRCTSFYEIPNNYSSRFIGTTTSDFTLGNLNVFLRSFTVGKSGISFIMERNGNLVASSIGKIDYGSIDNRVNVVNNTMDSIRIIGSTVLKEHPSNENITERISKFIDVNGVIWFVEISGFYIHENINWLTVVAFPNSDYRRSIKLGTILTVVFICLMILLSVAISGILSCCITKSLLKLRRLMRQVGYLKFDNILNKRASSFLFEVKSIQLAFQSMVYALQSFRKFVPEAIIKKSLKKRKVAEMSLIERDLTILFLDFIDFTKLTESLPPLKLIELVGEALEELSIIIEEEGGVIDKYIGDAIMALFNTPYNLEKFEERACIAAMRCFQRLKDKANDWNRRRLPSIQCRIGIHSGKALVGNFGSSKRLNFTAIGHHVNLAARLDPLCKLYQTNNLIGESTFEKVKDKFCCKFIDIVVVKGMSDPISVYSLMKERIKANENELRIEKICLKIKQYLQENNLCKLCRSIRKALEVNEFTNDYALHILLERCNQFENSSETQQSIGALVLTEKTF